MPKVEKYRSGRQVVFEALDAYRQAGMWPESVRAFAKEVNLGKTVTFKYMKEYSKRLTSPSNGDQSQEEVHGE